MIGVTSPAKCCCDEAPLEICIRLITYQFLCCEQRTYLYVSSPCAIDAIRVNGTTIATPGTNEFGGHPSTTPTITIGEDEVSGTYLTSASCCDGGDDPENETPYAISVAAVDCTYNVEVDTCGDTYECSITYCLQRTIVFTDLVYLGFSNTDTCSKETELGTSTRTITNDIDGFTIDDFQIDYCIPDEDGILIDIGAWTATFTQDDTIGLNNYDSTIVYDGELTLSISPWEQCLNVPDHVVYLLFTGDRTTSGTNIFGPFSETVTLTNFIVASIRVPRCVDPWDGLEITWIFCKELFDDGTDTLFCVCDAVIIEQFGVHSWC